MQLCVSLQLFLAAEFQTGIFFSFKKKPYALGTYFLSDYPPPPHDMTQAGLAVFSLDAEVFIRVDREMLKPVGEKLLVLRTARLITLRPRDVERRARKRYVTVSPVSVSVRQVWLVRARGLTLLSL